MPIVTTGQFTISDLNDGLSAVLSLSSFVASSDPDGSNPILTGAVTTISVLIGGADDSTNWTASATPSSGVNGNLVGRTYTVTGLNVDSGFVDITVSRSGYSSMTRRFLISKAKKGTRGSITTSRAISGSAWSDSEAGTAVSSTVPDSAIPGDTVTLYNSAISFSETRRFNGTSWLAVGPILGGDALVDGTIQDSKLTIADRSNLVVSPGFADTASWNQSSSFTRIASPSSAWFRNFVLQADDAAGTARATFNKPFEVSAGEVYFASGQCQVLTGSGSLSVQIQFSETETFAAITTLTVASTSSSSVTRVSGQVTVPAGMRFARFRFLKGAGVTSCYLGSPVVRRATSTELLPDEAVNEIERVYETTNTSVSSSVAVDILRMRVNRQSGFAADFDIDCVFEAFGNSMVVFSLIRSGSSKGSLEESVGLCIGGRIVRHSFSVTDFETSSGPQTYIVRARLAHSSASGGFDTPSVVKQVSMTVRQIKR